MVAAKRLLDLAKRLRPFRFRLPLPVESESLAAYAATRLGVVLGGPAKYLHSDPLVLLPEWPLDVETVDPLHHDRTFHIGAGGQPVWGYGPIPLWC
jgi:hypothetical protein